MSKKFNKKLIESYVTLINEQLEVKTPIKRIAELICKIEFIEYKEDYRKYLSGYINRNLGKEIPELNKSNNSSLIEDGEHFKQALLNKVNRKKYYIITSAQNSTPVHIDFFKNIKTYAEYLDAEIIVIPLRYKNPTSVFTDRSHDEWDTTLVPYLNATRVMLHKHLHMVGDIKIQPTNSMPLQGKELISGLNSCIIGHPRLHLKSIPRLPSYDPKVMVTTGSVTLPNFTDSNSGKVGEAHHTLGFVIVEIKDDEVFFMRQVSATEDGSFKDLCFNVEDQLVTYVDTIAALIPGDIHAGKHDSNVINLIEEKMLKRFNVEHVMIHDLSDMASVRKHDMKNGVKEYLAYKYETNDIQKELDLIYNFCDNWLKYNLHIVRSNHDEHLDQYIINQDWKKDVTNAVTYTKLLLTLLDEKAPKGLLPYLLDERYGDSIKTLSIDDSFRVLNWELGVHGHLGVNGAKGSNASFKRYSTKMIKGHDHSLSREDGCLSSGTCTVYDLGYNKGFTTWGQGFSFIHTDGKAQQCIIVDNDFTTFY